MGRIWNPPAGFVNRISDPGLGGFPRSGNEPLDSELTEAWSACPQSRGPFISGKSRCSNLAKTSPFHTDFSHDEGIAMLTAQPLRSIMLRDSLLAYFFGDSILVLRYRGIRGLIMCFFDRPLLLMRVTRLCYSAYEDCCHENVHTAFRRSRRSSFDQTATIGMVKVKSIRKFSWKFSGSTTTDFSAFFSH